MAKRNNRIDTEVIAMAVAGIPQRAIAEKLAISKTTVSKILQEAKRDRNLDKAIEVVQKNDQEERKNNKKTAHNVIDKIISGLEKDIDKASIKDKRELLKTLVELFGMPEDKEEDVTKITVEIEDASGDGTED